MNRKENGTKPRGRTRYGKNIIVFGYLTFGMKAPEEGMDYTVADEDFHNGNQIGEGRE